MGDKSSVLPHKQKYELATTTSGRWANEARDYCYTKESVWQYEFAAFRKLIFVAPSIPELTVHSRMGQRITWSGKDQ